MSGKKLDVFESLISTSAFNLSTINHVKIVDENACAVFEDRKISPY